MPSEKELAERFGVGRPSVRQALFTLQQQGLVEITSGTRARVTAPSGKFLTGQLATVIRRMTLTGQGHEHMEQARLLLGSAAAARLLAQAGRLSWHQGEYTLAIARSEEALALSRSVDEFQAGPLLTDQQLYESLLGASQEFATTLKDFRSNPKKFLRLKLF